MSIPSFAVRQPVLVNLVAISMVLVGALVLSAMHRESLPTMPTGWGTVTTVYVGASPEEIEQLVTIPVENAVGDVDKIQTIWSSSKEGVSYVSFELDSDVEDVTTAIMEVSNEINRIDDLPVDAERPVVREVKVDFPTISVAVRGEVPEVVLRQVGKDLAEAMHRAMSTVHAANICMWLHRNLKYDPIKEEFINDPEANQLRARTMRPPWTA